MTTTEHRQAIARRENGVPPPDVPLTDIDLGSLEFWERDDDLRDGAFATLRRESPITFFEVAEFFLGFLVLRHFIQDKIGVDVSEPLSIDKIQAENEKKNRDNILHILSDLLSNRKVNLGAANTAIAA